MLHAEQQRRAGTVLVIAAAVAWSTAPFFTRLLHFDSWTILFWRGLFGGSTIGMVAFIPALQLTSVANVAIFVAAQPFAAAAIAWIWLREVASPRTLLAMLVAFVGIVVIVSGAAGGADYGGIALACLMLLAIATMTVAIRRHRETSMVAAAAMSNFLGSLISIPFARDIGAITSADLMVFALFGFFQVGMGLTFFTLGSRLLPSGQASLIATLETPLMPFWVWLAFQEVPSTRALVGGALVLGAVIADIVVHNRSRSAVVQPAEH
jgi:drug/metabolite transporter (DMT)-like permease